MSEPVKKIKVALAGNPNSGKSTIFNYLTGAKQSIGNFPGVTVERYEGQTQCDGVKVDVIDLPGLYSITSKTDEEKVAGDYLRNEPYDVIVDIVDASNLERNLYLTYQLKELNRPTLVVLNMVDVARRRGIEIDTEKLSEALGMPIIETVGSKAVGIKEVLKKMTELGVEGRRRPQPAPAASQEGAQEELVSNEDVDCAACACPGCSKGCARVVALDMARYKEISQVCSRAVRNVSPSGQTFSDRVDAILTNRFIGIPIFLAAMYFVFWLTFTVGAYPMDWIDAGFGWLGDKIAGFWPEGSESFLKSLILDGIIGGVGGVIVFLPNIVILFLAISFLEDSGYLARAALLCDRWMSKLGLPGRSIVPFLVGFGCTIPALMATRMLNNRKERLVTLMVLPLFSCGARFPIYALLIPAFFAEKWRAPVLWIVYLVGIVLAVVLARILSLLLWKKGEENPFIIELPPYHLPTFRTVGMKTWERSLGYLKKAGTVILGASVLIWFLTTYPKATSDVHDEINARRDSVAAALEEFPEGDNAQVVGALKAKIGELELTDLEKEELNEALDAAAEKVVNVDELKEKIAALAMAESERAAVVGALDGALAEAEAEEPELAAGDVAGLIEELEVADESVKEKLGGLVEETAADPTLAADGLEEQLGVVFDREESQADLEASFAGHIGRGLEPILKPMGFDWKIGTSLVGAVAAKEVFVASMGIVYSVGGEEGDEERLGEVLQSQYTWLTAFCIMIFALIATPCAASLAVMAKESGSWKLAWTQWIGLTVIAWIVTTLIYQIGKYWL
ncbi:MAG: ferrous iron transport protein B [Thermoguttaceae bacterium]|nr:ferrous iron transport protein B [Thermoguttaceae bacterium]